MIKRTLFLFFFYSGVIFVCIFFLPALILPQKITLYGGRVLGFWSKFCLELFLSTKIVIKGKEKILKNKKFFIASAHQSQFETFFLCIRLLLAVEAQKTDVWSPKKKDFFV